MMARGIHSLTVIASTAPFLGILGMLVQTPQTLYVLTLPPMYGDYTDGTSELFVLPALGLIVASVAMLLHRVLSHSIEHFRTEIKAGTLQLMNDLVRPSTTF